MRGFEFQLVETLLALVLTEARFSGVVENGLKALLLPVACYLSHLNGHRWSDRCWSEDP